MKNILVSLSALGLLFNAGICVAGDYTLPAEKAAIAISFPDDWKIEAEGNAVDSLVANTADEAIEIDLWAVDKQELKENADATLGAMIGEVSTLIDEYIVDFQADKPVEAKINEIDVFEISGKGKTKEGGEQVNASVTLLTPDNQNLFVLMYWGSDEAEKKYAEQLKTIISSLKKP